jgi:hypothetical protein
MIVTGKSTKKKLCLRKIRRSPVRKHLPFSQRKKTLWLFHDAKGFQFPYNVNGFPFARRAAFEWILLEGMLIKCALRSNGRCAGPKSPKLSRY